MESRARYAAACVISIPFQILLCSSAAICPSAPCRIMAKLPHQFVFGKHGSSQGWRSLSSWSLFVLLFHANLPCLDSFGHRQISGTEHAFKGPQSGNSLLLSGMSHRIWLVGCPRSTSLTLNLAKTGPEQAELTITNVLNTARVEGCKMQTSTGKKSCMVTVLAASHSGTEDGASACHLPLTDLTSFCLLPVRIVNFWVATNPTTQA